MSRRKRRQAPQPSEPATPAVPDRNWRRIALGALVIAACALAGYYATGLFAKKPTAVASVPQPRAAPGNGAGPKGMVWVPGGGFLMGSDHKLAQANERPAHRVNVAGFWMDRHHVTNAQFRDFVKATGYVTTAERKPDWETIRVQVAPGTPRPSDSELVPGAMVF